MDDESGDLYDWFGSDALDGGEVVTLDPFVVTGGDGEEISAEDFDAMFADFLGGGAELPLLDLAPYGFTYDPSGIVIPTNPSTVTPSAWNALKEAFKKAASAAIKSASGGSGGASGGGSSSSTQPKPTTTTTNTLSGMSQNQVLLLVGGVAAVAILAVALVARRK